MSSKPQNHSRMPYSKPRTLIGIIKELRIMLGVTFLKALSFEKLEKILDQVIDVKSIDLSRQFFYLNAHK